MTQLQSNDIASVICHILADGLRQKIRILPSTLTSILEVSLTMLTSNTHDFELEQAISMPENLSSVITSQILRDPVLADSGVQFLQNHIWSDISSEDDLVASVAVAKFVLETVSRDPIRNSLHWPDSATEVRVLDLVPSLLSTS
jgi:hypothetical protein